jgi:hypothetical protein
MAIIRLQDYSIDVSKYSFESLLSDWKWLIKEPLSPFLMTLFGDVFLKDSSNGFWWLDIFDGKLHRIADSQENFYEFIGNPQKFVELFMVEIVNINKQIGMNLSENQCYSFKVPPIFGGELDPENIEVCDIFVNLSINGQIHQQVKDLPPGTKITDIKFE